MTFTDIGHTGASKQTWHTGPRKLLKSLLDEAKDPYNGRVLFVDFLAAVLPDQVRSAFDDEEAERRIVSIIEYWFTNHHDYLLKMYYPKPGEKQREAVAKKSRTQKQNKIREAVREKITEKAKLLLMDWVMPNGKAIGDCTGKEVRGFSSKVSPWLAKVAERVKPKQIVRDVLNEVDMQKMWRK